jgi:signal transduction histidine kinase
MRIRHIQEEEKISLQQAELMALFAELSPDLILRFNSKGKVVLANNSAHQVFHKKFMLGGQIDDVLPRVSRFNYVKLIESGGQEEFTVKIEDKYYQFILAGVSKINVGQLYGRDITELKEKEEALKIALEKAEEAQKLKADFLARISHEIRSPLVAIQGYSELIMSDYMDNYSSELKRIFGSIDKNSKRLYRTVDLILNMSQLQTGKYEPKLDKVNLTEILSVIHSEFKSSAQEKNLDFNFKEESDTSPVVLADEYSVKQIFINLVDNAIKFTSKGEVSISIYEENSHRCVRVKDTGIGISTQYLENMFTPFSQEKTGYTRPYEGTGLGLALVKNYVDINKASITVDTDPKTGSAFTVKFKGDLK